MKCECDECHGSGTITCLECDGQGTFHGEIESIHLSRSVSNYNELIELQKDAKRVIRQAQRLEEINPARSLSYTEQLKATLLIINAQADRAVTKKF